MEMNEGKNDVIRISELPSPVVQIMIEKKYCRMWNISTTLEE